MIATNYSNVRQNFARYCDEVVRNEEAIIITRRRDENVVLLSEATYNNMLENLRIRSNREDYARLLKSIDHLEHGKGQKQELVEDE